MSTNPTGRPVAHVIPWEAMTAREQAEHLVYAHGFDAAYFAPRGGWDLSDKDVMLAFLVEQFTERNTDGESFPHPDGRDGWHGADHAEYVDQPELMPRPHTHDKVTDHDALTWAIFALNTLAAPDASEPVDVETLDDVTHSVVDRLAAMRARLTGGATP